MSQTKIKLIYLIDTFAIGGAERLVLDMCKRLDQTVFEFEVWAVVTGGPMQSEFEKSDIRVKVFKKKTKLGLELIRPIYRQLKQAKPDLVHTHLFGADTWGRLAAIWARVPVIVSTEHNINLDQSWFKRKIQAILSLWTDKIIAVSQGVKNYAVKNEKIKPEKIKVIYNGIDLDRFQFRGFQPLEPKQIKAVVMARLSEQKGHRYLLSAMPQIIKKYPGFTLHIVGGGNLQPLLIKQAEKLMISDRVKFLGQTNQPAKVLAAMDLFILPSVWEGLGLVVLEAQAVGLPVLASDISGVNEIITDQQTGLLFKSQDPQAIFQAVDLLLSQPDLQQKIVKQAHEQVQDFSLTKMVAAYTDLYLELINRKT